MTMLSGYRLLNGPVRECVTDYTMRPESAVLIVEDNLWPCVYQGIVDFEIDGAAFSLAAS